MAERAFPQRVIEHLRQHQPDDIKTLTDDVLRTRVHKGLSKGHRNGLTWESSLMSYVSLLFRVGPNFDDQPNIRKALREGEGTPNERMQQLPHNVSIEDWKEAKRIADHKLWEQMS